MNRFRSYLEALIDVDDADWNYFSCRLIKREFPKKSIFLNIGEVENYISFIEKGGVRLFIPNEDAQNYPLWSLNFVVEIFEHYFST